MSNCLPFSVSSIPLRLTSTPTKLCYQSAIALKVGNLGEIAPEILCQELAAQLQKRRYISWEGLEIPFSVEPIQSVWLNLVIAYADLMPWLSWVSEQITSPSELFSGSLTLGLTAPSPFAYVQYVHVRMLALQRLYAEPPRQEESSPSWTLPPPLRSLLATIIQTLDNWEQESPTKLALNLSKALLSFENIAWQYRPSFQTDSNLIYFSYHLIIIGQRLLSQLLKERLCYTIPQEI